MSISDYTREYCPCGTFYWESYLRPCDVKTGYGHADSLREDGHLVLPFFWKHNRPVLDVFLHASTEYNHSFHVADDGRHFVC
jgi:hypothetical protein